MDRTTERLARFVESARGSTLPAEVVHECKRRIIDGAACAGAAFAEPFCARVRAFSERYMGAESARIWGTTRETSIEMAAFANGTMVRFLDYNDTFMDKTGGHPSDMIPGLIGLAESVKHDGATLIKAIVVAYEVYCGLCASVALDVKGLDQAVAAAAGAAAGASYLLHLTVEQTGNALSLAIAPNIHLFNVRCGTLSEWKGCAGPNGVRNGIFAAMLARDGFTGPTAVVEGKTGLFDLIGSFEWQIGSLERPLLLSTNIKRHPACYHGQAAIDVAMDLRGKMPAGQIDDIHIEVYDAAYQVMGSDRQKWAPSTRETADHSLPYVVAVTLEEGRLAAEAYAEQRMQQGHTRTLMDKVRVSSSSEMTAAFPARLQTRITARDAKGAAHTLQADYPKGHVQNPLADAELEEKFLQNYASLGGSRAARRCLETLWSADRLPAASAIVDALCPAN